ncbi:MAG: DegT/DnrJ/EryC1/StrS family aminotransferase [Candidatus Levybacteria bacterium]|nr:DegT/DnrJ/EryC1/StrS family aminotransferase [Candidatus Levybacteria bacterium]
MKIIRQMDPWIDREEEKEVIKVMRSGWITEADETKRFEKMIADFTGSKYCSVVTNGTVSLYLALKALGIGEGDEVIVPDMTMVASPNAVIMANAKPVFVDIEKDTLCLSLDEVEKKISKKTKAIMIVALNGRAPDMHRALKIAKDNNLFVVEDAAQALGSYFHGKHLGTFGDIGSFSFSTPKVITTAQGGALVTDRKDLYDKIIRLKDFGRVNRSSQNHDEIGFNFKFTDILAAIGVVQMKKLPTRLNRKKEMYNSYKQELKNLKQIQFIATDLSQTSPWFMDIFVSDPKALQGFLKNKNIGTRLFYPAIHTTEPYKSENQYKNSLWASEHGLWLPSSAFLTDSDIMHICKEIKSFYEKN